MYVYNIAMITKKNSSQGLLTNKIKNNESNEKVFFF